MFHFILIPLIVGSLFFVGMSLSTSADNEDFLVVAMSFLIVVPFSAIALIAERKDVFSPLNILTYILIVSAPVFCVYVLYFADDWNAEYAVFWQEFVDITPGIIITAFAFVALLIGYFYFSIKSDSNRSRATIDEAIYSIHKLRMVGLLVLLITVVSGFMFAKDVNYAASLADNVLSKKSIHEATVGMAIRGSALMHWRLLGISLPHAFIIVFMALVWLRKLNAGTVDYVLLSVIFFISCFIPFIASTRTPILEVLIVLVMLRHYLVKETNLAKLVLIGFAGMMVIGTLGELRRNPDKLVLASVSASVDSVVGSAYFVDLGKTSIVVNRVPSSVDYLYGSSLVSIGLTLVPRQLWPDKPVVRIGFFVGQEIIRLNNRTGIPPGFVAETYLNFGYWGIFPMFFLLGCLMRKIYDQLLHQRNFKNTVTYVVGIVIVSLSLLSTDVTYAIVQVISYATPIYVIHRFAKIGYSTGSSHTTRSSKVPVKIDHVL